MGFFENQVISTKLGDFGTGQAGSELDFLRPLRFPLHENLQFMGPTVAY